MKFDFVIGNPPYQESDGGSGASAKPVYQKFVEAAKQLDPKSISMIMPAKWYSGGKGLDEFRTIMLNDKRISCLVDYTNSLDCFPGVDVAGGICFFVWNKNHDDLCNYTNYYNGIEHHSKRKLNEFDIFLRYPTAVNIIHKVQSFHEKTLDGVVSSRKPFGLDTKVRPLSDGDIRLRYNGGIGCFDSKAVPSGREMINQWKVLISYLTAEHAGQPDKNGQFRILSTMELVGPGTVCSETYLVAGAFITESEATNYMYYLKTKFVRFLIGQIAVTQHISKGVFSFVPVQDFSKRYTDEELYKKYNLTDDEIFFVERMIKEYR